MGIVQTFILISECTSHYQDGAVKVGSRCECVRRLHVRGPFGSAILIAGHRVEWVFTCVDGVSGANHINGSPITEIQAILLCAVGRSF